MPSISYPDELKKAHWDKRKGALDGADALASQLKDLQKQHEGVDWDKLAPGWAKGLSQADKLQAAYEALDKLLRSKTVALKTLASGVESAAEKAGKGKEASKLVKETCASVAKAAAAYGKALGKVFDELEAELALAKKSLKPDEADEDEDEAGSALVDPKRLLKLLKLCKAEPGRRLNFGMVDDGKQDPVLVLSPRLTPKAIMARLVKDLEIKTGAFGTLSLNEDADIQLVVEKKVSGLVKRIRIPIRACGFKLGKVRVVDEQGTLLDEDLEEQLEAGDGAGAESGDAATARAQALQAALEAWAQARTAAITSLKAVAKEIADLKDPESAKAVVEISAVVKQLTAEPRTAQQISELKRYVDEDDVVLDVSDFAQDIRTPLLTALGQLEQAIVA